MRKNKVIAIDGPAGAGKSTIAKIVAGKLGFLYIDTGAMFRAVAWKIMEQSICVDENEKLTELLSMTSIVLLQKNNILHVFCDDIDVSQSIRDNRVSQHVSEIATIPAVRSYLLAEQRKLAQNNDVVMDGRDIGTVVFPEAQLKIFLEASSQIRAKRRLIELEQSGYAADIKEIELQIKARDKMDREREIAPLVKAKDAVEIDTSDLTIDEVVGKILTLYKKGI